MKNAKTTAAGTIIGILAGLIPALPKDYQALAGAVIGLATAILGLIARDPSGTPPTTPPSAVPVGA